MQVITLEGDSLEYNGFKKKFKKAKKRVKKSMPKNKFARAAIMATVAPGSEALLLKKQFKKIGKILPKNKFAKALVMNTVLPGSEIIVAADEMSGWGKKLKKVKKSAKKLKKVGKIAENPMVQQVAFRAMDAYAPGSGVAAQAALNKAMEAKQTYKKTKKSIKSAISPYREQIENFKNIDLPEGIEDIESLVNENKTLKNLLSKVY